MVGEYIKPEVFGLTVPRGTFGVTINAEQSGFTVEAERMGADATRLVPGGGEQDSYWVWGGGGWILWGDGQEILL